MPCSRMSFLGIKEIANLILTNAHNNNTDSKGHVTSENVHNNTDSKGHVITSEKCSTSKFCHGVLHFDMS